MRHGSWLFVAYVACITGCQESVDPAVAALFQQAQEAFDQARTSEDFLRAAGMYEQIVRSGIQSGTVFYNQGNAYARAGQRGRAIACYRLAQRYRPRDPQLDANLRFVTQGHSPSDMRPLLENVLFWQNWISYPEKFRLTVACAAVALGLGVAGVILRSTSWNRLALAALLFTLAMACSAAYDWHRFVRLEYGVVTRNDVVARKGDAESYEAAFTTPLAEGTELRVLERRRDWVRVQLAGSQQGWVKAGDVVIY